MRSDTIICAYCSKPAPNSKSGMSRKYHIGCGKKLRAEKEKKRRESPVVQAREKKRKEDKRDEIKKDPVLLERERELQRARQVRLQTRAKLYEETKSELTKARVGMAKASDALVEAASNVNAKFADHEERIRQLESRSGTEGSNDDQGVPGEQDGVDPAVTGDRRSTIFDRLHG